MSGIEVLKALRPQQPNLPVIMLTAHSSVATAVDAMRAGASDFLLKPASPDRLTKALAAALARKAPAGALRPLTETIPGTTTRTRIVSGKMGAVPEELGGN